MTRRTNISNRRRTRVGLIAFASLTLLSLHFLSGALQSSVESHAVVEFHHPAIDSLRYKPNHYDASIVSPLTDQKEIGHDWSNHLLDTTKERPLLPTRSSDGTKEYIADPTALKRGREAFLHRSAATKERMHSHSMNDYNVDFWAILQGYGMENTTTWNMVEILSPDYICALGPGRGMEQDSGYKVLVEKVDIADSDANAVESSATTAERRRNAMADNNSPRILCAIYTYSGMRNLARTAALTWGYKCDGFLAFSNETIPSLGMIDLPHKGEESYTNMWQKTRSIWAYIYDNYRTKFDFFHLGGDDHFVVVENLRHFLQKVHDSTPTGTPLHLGQWVSQPGDSYMISGGPGYTLNQEAVKRLVEDALPNCDATSQVAFEDRLISKCLRSIGISGSDTRDFATGEQQYHDTDPAQLYIFRSNPNRRGPYHSRIAVYWEGLPHPWFVNQTVGPKHGLEAAAKYSVSFHDLHNPQYMTRIHTLLYRNTCPSNSPLGIGLRSHVRI